MDRTGGTVCWHAGIMTHGVIVVSCVGTQLLHARTQQREINLMYIWSLKSNADVPWKLSVIQDGWHVRTNMNMYLLCMRYRWIYSCVSVRVRCMRRNKCPTQAWRMCYISIYLNVSYELQKSAYVCTVSELKIKIISLLCAFSNRSTLWELCLIAECKMPASTILSFYSIFCFCTD